MLIMSSKLRVVFYAYTGGPKKTSIKSIFQFNGKREFRTSEAFTSYFSNYFQYCCSVSQPNSKYF